jgi:hypothetical protein
MASATQVRGVSDGLRWFLLAVLLLAVCAPRFNLWDPGPIKRFTASATDTPYGLPLDVEGYRRLSEYFRGDTPADSLISPFCFRPLVPAAASLLPFSSLTSINLLNLVSLFLTVVVLDRTMKQIGLGERARLVGALLFIVSFPTFYYGTLGFVDPPSLLVVSIASFLILRGQDRAMFALVPLAVLVKETNAIIALLPAIRGWASGERPIGPAVRLSATLAFIALLVAAGIRVVAPFPDPEFIWWPRLAAVLKNTSRPRAQLSFLLTAGLPTLLAVVGLFAGRVQARIAREQYRYFVGGSLLALSLYGYSLTAAYADGRVVWIIYPFAIPLAAAWFERQPVPKPEIAS